MLPRLAEWQTVSYTGIAITPEIGLNIWDEFVFNLLQAGEVLIDDISVIENPGTAFAMELIQDGTFSSAASLDTYRGGGNHGDISVVVDPDNPSESVLRLRATGPPEHNHNHVETTLAFGAEIQVGTTYQISYRAKWISGSNQLGTRLYFNYLPRTELLERPNTVGTPGAVNSTVETNIGPAFSDLSQNVVTPAANQAVIISVVADDPDGVNNVQLWYRVDEGVWNSVAMNIASGSLYLGAIPGQSAGAIVQFYVEGTDSQGASATFPADGADSRALYRVATSASNSKNSIEVITLESESDRLVDNSNASSNQPIGATVIDETGKIYYDVGFRLRGSDASRPNTRTRGFWIGFDPEDLYRGVHESVIIDRARPNQLLSNHLLHAAGDVPSFYEDAVNFVSTVDGSSGQAVLKLARYGDIYLDGRQDDGSDGNVFDFDLLYTPTRTIDGDPESPKDTSSWNHTNGSGDFTSYGADKELYRHTYTLQNNRGEDDYSGLIQFLSAFDAEGDELYAQVDQIGDIDQIARVFTALSLLGMNDLYTRLFQHNLRLYENPDTGKFEALPWDLDSAYRLSVNAPLWSSPNDGQINKLFDLPQVSRLMYGYADHMIQTTFNREFAEPWANHFGAVSQSNLGSNLNYVENRANVVASQLPALAQYAITTNSGSDFSVASSQVTLQGTGSYKIRDLQIDGIDEAADVTWLDDTTWEVTVELVGGTNDLTIRALDYFGDEIHSDSITVTAPLDATVSSDNLRISEIHYNPADPTNAEIAAGFDNNNDFEFLELYNPSTTGAINLNGVRLADGVTFDFGNVNLPAGERAVVVKDTNAFQFRYGTSIQVLGEYGADTSLSNGGEQVRLVDSLGQVIHDFTYDDVEPWAVSADGDGPSLEVINVNGDYSDPTNWQASATDGGTPGDVSAAVAPQVVSVIRDNGSIARPGEWSTIDVEFSAGVDLTADSLVLRNDTEGGALVDLSGITFSHVAGSSTATWDLSSLNASLDAAYYSVTLDSSLIAGSVGGSVARRE